MNEGAVCSQGSLASCCRCCAWRARLTLNPVAWPGTNICAEQLGTARGTPGHRHCLGGHLGTGTPGRCPGDTWAPSTAGHCWQGQQRSGVPGLGNTGCRRARGSDGDTAAGPVVVPGPLGHVRPSPPRAMCLGSCLSQPGGQALLPPCHTQQCFLLQFRVMMGQRPQGLPLRLRPCLGGTAKPPGWSGCCFPLNPVLNAPRFPPKPLIPPGSAPASALGPVSSPNPLRARFRDTLGAASLWVSPCHPQILLLKGLQAALPVPSPDPCSCYLCQPHCPMGPRGAVSICAHERLCPVLTGWSRGAGCHPLLFLIATQHPCDSPGVAHFPSPHFAGSFLASPPRALRNNNKLR